MLSAPHASSPSLALAALHAPGRRNRPRALPLDFDPARDPAKDLEVALRIARAAGRRVIVDVGGEWCSWCHIMDRFFAANPDLKRYRDANYVWLKVNWSRGEQERSVPAPLPGD